ncbi:transposase [Spirosoma horti]
MKMITPDYLNRAELWLLMTMLAYFLVNGAQLFETAVLIPRWSAKPPASLSVLQGPYAPDLKTFWVVAHSLHEMTFLVAIGLCWQISPVRNALLFIFAAHFLIRLWTLGYFAPNIMNFQQANIDGVSTQLPLAVGKWRRLNYIRVTLFLLLSVAVAVVHWKLKTGQFNTGRTTLPHQIIEP